jgi:hypothetical protein
MASKAASSPLSPLAYLDELLSRLPDAHALPAAAGARYASLLTPARVRALPLLTRAGYWGGGLAPNSLVRVVGMVQDMFASEFYAPVRTARDGARVSAAFRDTLACDDELDAGGAGAGGAHDAVAGGLAQRHNIMIVPLPAEAAWARALHAGAADGGGGGDDAAWPAAGGDASKRRRAVAGAGGGGDDGGGGEADDAPGAAQQTSKRRATDAGARASSRAPRAAAAGGRVRPAVPGAPVRLRGTRAAPGRHGRVRGRTHGGRADACRAGGRGRGRGCGRRRGRGGRRRRHGRRRRL